MCTERSTTILQEKIINTSGIQKHLEPITGCCKTFEAILHSKCAAENFSGGRKRFMACKNVEVHYEQRKSSDQWRIKQKG